jgi:TonB family protein
VFLGYRCRLIAIVTLPEAMPDNSDLLDLRKAYSWWVHRMISRCYFPAPGATQTHATVVSFQITRKGSVYGTKVLQSSSDDKFDEASLASIQRAKHFRPIPPEIPGNLLVRCTFKSDRCEVNTIEDIGSVMRNGFFDPKECLTEPAMSVMSLAEEESQRLKHNFVGPGQILVGLLLEEKGIAAQVLTSMGVELPNVRLGVRKIIGMGSADVGLHPPLNVRAVRLLELSCDEADKLESDKVDTEHFLLAIIREGDGVATRVLVNQGLDLKNVELRLMEKLKGSSD